MKRPVFNHINANIPKITQVNKPEGRRYVDHEGSDQTFSFPSITTLLGEVSDKTALFEWRKRVGNEEANRISTMATTRGTAFHDMCEHYLLNEDEEESNNVSANFMFRSMKSYLNECDNIRALETGLYSKDLRVAGMVDCIAEYKGVLSIIDFKTSRKPKRKEWIENYFQQGSFYLKAYYELTDEFPKQIVILIACEDGTVQEFIVKGQDLVKYSTMLKESIIKYYNKRG